VSKQVEFDGTIASVSGHCPAVRITVNGFTIDTDPSTDYKKSGCPDLRNGRSVSGEGMTQPDGTVKATQLQVKKE
jgi:hypothetical protein